MVRQSSSRGVVMVSSGWLNGGGKQMIRRDDVIAASDHASQSLRQQYSLVSEVLAWEREASHHRSPRSLTASFNKLGRGQPIAGCAIKGSLIHAAAIWSESAVEVVYASG